MIERKYPGRPATYNFDSLKAGEQLLFDYPFTSLRGDIKLDAVRISSALNRYKKRRGVNWSSAVRRQGDSIVVYRLN